MVQCSVLLNRNSSDLTYQPKFGHSSTMNTLPIEVMQRILDYIPLGTLTNIRLVCRYFGSSEHLSRLTFRKIPFRLSISRIQLLRSLSEHPHAIHVQEIVFCGNTLLYNFLPHDLIWRDLIDRTVPEDSIVTTELAYLDRKEDERTAYEQWATLNGRTELLDQIFESWERFPNLNKFSFHFFLGNRVIPWNIAMGMDSRIGIPPVPSGLPEHFKRVVYTENASGVNYEIDPCYCFLGVDENWIIDQGLPVGVFATLMEHFPYPESTKFEFAYSTYDCFRLLISEDSSPVQHYSKVILPRLDTIYLKELDFKLPITPLLESEKYPFQILSRASNLQSISIEFAMPPGDYMDGYINYIFGTQYVWKKLRILSLRGFDMNSGQFYRLIYRHAETIEEIALACINLRYGSWQEVMRNIKHRMPKLKRLELRGKLLDHDHERRIREFSGDASGMANTGDLKKMHSYVLGDGPCYPSIYDIPANVERWL
ncbi:hypothetical protein RUND412_003673 [Rhizina undulata]